MWSAYALTNYTIRATLVLAVSLVLAQFYQISMSAKVAGGGKVVITKNVVCTLGILLVKAK
jgi:hypothetical protein